MFEGWFCYSISSVNIYLLSCISIKFHNVKWPTNSNKWVFKQEIQIFNHQPVNLLVNYFIKIKKNILCTLFLNGAIRSDLNFIYHSLSQGCWSGARSGQIKPVADPGGVDSDPILEAHQDPEPLFKQKCPNGQISFVKCTGCPINSQRFKYRMHKNITSVCPISLLYSE